MEATKLERQHIKTNQKKGQFCVVATALQIQDRKSLEPYENIVLTVTAITLLVSVLISVV